MATNFNGYSNSNNGYALHLIISSTQNQSNNSSNVSWQLYLERTGSGRKYFSGATVNDGHLAIAGTSRWNISGQNGFNFASSPQPAGYKKTLTTGSFTIKHNSDGNKSINVDAGFSAPSGGYGPTGLRLTKTVTLPKISKPAPTRAIRIDSIDIGEDVPTIRNRFNFFIQHQSKLNIQTRATPSTGAVINKIQVSVNGRTYTGSNIHTSVITASGIVPVKVTAYDNKGYSVTQTRNITVQPYTKPNIKELTVSRTNAYGSVDSTGEYAKVSYAYNVEHLKDKNTVAADIKYGDSTKRIDNYNYDVRSSTIVYIGSKPVTIKLILNDYFNQVSKEYQVDPLFVTMDFGVGGDKVAIGAEAVDEGLTINMKTNFLQSIRKKGLPMAQFLHMNNLSSNTDLGHTLTNAIYSISGTYPGAPSSTNYYGVLINIARYNTEIGLIVNRVNYCFQIIINANGRVWIRSRWNGTFNPWKEIGA